MPSPHHIPADLYVLHTLRCIGFTTAARLAQVCGMAESDVESELIDHARNGLVNHERGEFGGWGVTGDGRAVDDERIAADLDAAGARDAVLTGFDRFAPLNPEMLDICSAWQLRTVNDAVRPNDHSDPGYDARVLGRLADLDRRAQAMLAGLAAVLVRFERYVQRTGNAMDRIRAGEIVYVADHLESYHSVWFQLHEDLLTTLGIPRY